jgi:RNA polymerase sigma factor (TIGR02999 family)
MSFDGFKMADSPIPSPTELFHQWRGGDKDALQLLLPIVYAELRRVARQHLRNERADHTLQTTALIHEAYIRLVEQKAEGAWDRSHFVALTSHLMRQILVDHARQRLAMKRNGGERVPLTEELAASDQCQVNALAVDDALTRLSKLDMQQARVVELRYYGGLSIRETSDVLGISEATVKRDWATARVWLHQEMRSAEMLDL